jgi:hypothetical protein
MGSNFNCSYMTMSSLTYIPFLAHLTFRPYEILPSLFVRRPSVHRDHPVRFGLIWFSDFRGEDLNVIFYRNMQNLHNRYKSAERKIVESKLLIKANQT